MKNKLNKTQKAAVESFGNPILIFAGAGSGKTRVLTHKISYLIEKKLVKAENILALTFTNKAAKEMKSRVEKLVNNNGVLVTMGTFHSICAKILRHEIHHLGYGKDFSILDVQDQISLIKIILDEMGILKNSISPQEARNQISFYKNKLINPSIAKRKANLVIEKTYAEIYNNYQKSLFSNNAVDFDDLLQLPLELFGKNQKILDKYREIWKYVLVDEYQDTNKPQFMLIKLLAGEHKQVCVVGDDDQSIYGWRGADIRNILEFEKTFKKCEVFKLEKNYRSTGNILDAAISVIKNNKMREPKDLIANNGNGDKIGLIETHDEMEEADALISALQ